MTTGGHSSRLEERRVCGWCRGGISATARRDSVYCSKRCRQAAHRFGRGAVARRRTTAPARLAYADPPYPGLAWLYRDHPDYGGEVDHDELLSRLQEYDGWALSTSARALPEIVALASSRGITFRVAAWIRGSRGGSSYFPRSSWEPVLYVPARPGDPDRPAIDSLQHVAAARRTDPDRVIGAKPAAFIWWLFELLGALPGDDLDDLFPGSGGVTRAWDLYASRSSTDATPRVGLEDASRATSSDASSPAGDDASSRALDDTSAAA